MEKSSSLQKYFSTIFSDKASGFFLDLNNCDIAEEELNDLESTFQAALSAMEALETGSIANPDEDRQVGHYWLRNPDLAPNPFIKTQIVEALTAINDFSNDILNGNILSPDHSIFTDILLIGIGGSALGPQLIADTLENNAGLKIHFLDNTDPDGIDRTLLRLSESLFQTLVIVISKSGGTAETRNAMLEVQQVFTTHNLDFSKHAVAITGVESQLFQQALNEDWLSTFPMWDWVGGRTSVMSAVGLLPAALMGVDIDSFLSGARAMDELTRSKNMGDNPAALLALAWLIIGKGRGDKDMVILPYKDRMQLFSRYLQQLIMESLGKSHDIDGNLVNQGIAVYGNKGSTDQHAYMQQLRDGVDNFFVTFIEVLRDRIGDSILVDSSNNSGDYLFGFLRGTEAALSQNNRKSLTITIPDLSPQSVGALIALYERAVGFYASLININAYHQPGVEAGKKAAGNVLNIKNRILDILTTVDHCLTIEEIAELLNLPGKENLIYQILRHHAANHSMAIEGSFFDPLTLKIGLPQISH
ncbi:glucose-6-phosphate isomerase [bacterium]|nr:glucose-6-phosphate isomerase [bacterium]